MWWLGKRWEATGDNRTRMVMGRAVAEGMAHAFRETPDGAAGLDTEPAVAVAHRLLEQEWTDDPEWTLEGAKLVLTKSIREGLKQTPEKDLYRGGRVIAVEKDLGGMRPDVIFRWPTGLAVVDHKWSEQQRPEYIESRLQKQETDVQLWSYADRVSEFYGEPVVAVGHHVITVTPRIKSWFDPVVVTPERLATFKRDVERAWAQMTKDKVAGAVPMGRWTACHSRDENFGRCRFYDFCHLYHRDEALVEALYNRRS